MSRQRFSRVRSADPKECMTGNRTSVEAAGNRVRSAGSHMFRVRKVKYEDKQGLLGTGLARARSAGPTHARVNIRVPRQRVSRAMSAGSYRGRNGRDPPKHEGVVGVKAAGFPCKECRPKIDS